MRSVGAVVCRNLECTTVNPSDDLTQIRGIGITSQDRLYRAGIKTFDRLARMSSDEVRAILGAAGQDSRVESWIKEAAKLAEAS